MMKLSELKPDISAGFSVALVALPLSIGISLASGAPASAGLITAIVGGILGSLLGGTQLTINGPAAGLIVIVLDAITSIGGGDMAHGFRGMLAASVVAGAIQIIFGLLKFGRKSSLFPVCVIHGMMAAIGLIILVKQIPVLLGYAPVAKNPILLIGELPRAFLNLQPSIFMVGAASLAILVFFNKVKASWAKKMPAPLITVLVGATIAMLIGLPEKSLLQIPANVSNWIILPDFSVMSTYAGWKAAITLALVASLETMLSAAAVDKIDPQRRKSDLDRDLLSKGVCNALCGLIGGLPMIAEIVRSSANVTYGAKTRYANFFHGSFILVAVLLLPMAMAYIPLASLAAILIMVGFRLGNPAHLVHAKKVGIDNLVGFAVTLFMTMAVDLLVGIFLGYIAQFLTEMFLGLKLQHSLKSAYQVDEKNQDVRIETSSALTFSNFLSLKELMDKYLANNKNVTLILEKSQYIDHSVMEQINDLKHEFKLKNLQFNMVFSNQHVPMGQDQLSAMVRKIA